MRSVATAHAVLQGHPSPNGALVLSITGALDTNSTAQAWREAVQLIDEHRPGPVIVDASRMTYCDGAGAALRGPPARGAGAHRGRPEGRAARRQAGRAVRGRGPLSATAAACVS